MKKINRLVALSLVFVCLFLCACHKLSGNQLDFRYLPNTFEFIDGVAEFESGNGQIFHVDLNKKEFLATDSDGEYLPPPVNGGTAPRYLIEIDEEYEGIRTHLSSLELKNNDRSVIYTQGYLLNGEIWGICNVYHDTVGYLSGGGNYGMEEISHSIYYKYDYKKDIFERIAKIDGACALAFSKNKLIYWRDKNLYFFDIDSNEELFLCEDLSYDFGLQHQSRGVIYFNEQYALFRFAKAKGSTDVYYAFIFDFSNKNLIQLTCEQQIQEI